MRTGQLVDKRVLEWVAGWGRGPVQAFKQTHYRLHHFLDLAAAGA
jgi:hypothetical protein